MKAKYRAGEITYEQYETAKDNDWKLPKVNPVRYIGYERLEVRSTDRTKVLPIGRIGRADERKQCATSLQTVRRLRHRGDNHTSVCA